MTVISKPSFKIEKIAEQSKSLVKGRCCVMVDENVNYDEEKVEFQIEDWAPGRWTSGVAAFLCMFLAALLVALTGVTCGLMLYRQYTKSGNIHRYQGYCSIPIDLKRQMELQTLPKAHFWTDRSYAEPTTSEMLKEPQNLYEEVDISDGFETITVFDNGREVNFVNDFVNNYTSVIDETRCFLMDLMPSLSMPPELFVFSIENGDDFDISHVQLSLNALLPDLTDLSHTTSTLAERCNNRPTYLLRKSISTPIRKRSADEPSSNPHYIHFAGRHVQEITITNFNDLVEYEKKLKTNA